jgi:gliding motility-associated-like protein
LLAANKSFSSYLWSNGSTANEITIKGAGKYFADVTDNFGCSGSDTVNIKTKKCLEGFFMPNAFTPNNDGNNDLLFPKLLGDVSQYSFAIYNRWGGKVFESNLLKNGWDGTIGGVKQAAGIYIWKCTYMLDDKSVYNEKGTVVLIR